MPFTSLVYIYRTQNSQSSCASNIKQSLAIRMWIIWLQHLKSGSSPLTRNPSCLYLVIVQYCFLEASQAHLSTICMSDSSPNGISTSLFLSLSELTVPVSAIAFESLAAKRKLPVLVSSTREFSSWKESPIETRTRMIVGVIP